VTQWQSLGNPVELAATMWAHSANMREAFSARKIALPELTGQDVSDLLIYARNMPSNRAKSAAFSTVSAGNGGALFESKRCSGCHTGRLALAPRLRGRTLSDIAAAMWNHPKMGTSPPSVDASEMSQIVTWLWSQQVLEAGGNVAAGKQVFAAKGCGGCHGVAGSGAPSLAAHKGTFSAVSMVSGLWQHGPQMLARMKQKSVVWPRFTSAEMANLIAYIDAGQ
jgi:cytochrome c551/c552